MKWQERRKLNNEARLAKRRGVTEEAPVQAKTNKTEKKATEKKKGCLLYNPDGHLPITCSFISIEREAALSGI